MYFFQKLAEEAEEKIEDTDPPLFLRFINLLINDAIFLLDEAFDVSKQEEINLCLMISTAEMFLGVSVYWLPRLKWFILWVAIVLYDITLCSNKFIYRKCLFMGKGDQRNPNINLQMKNDDSTVNIFIHIPVN